MTFDIITQDGKEFALVPVDIFEKLSQEAEMLADIEAYEQAKHRLASDEDEIIPLSIIERRLNGESSVKIWREYRNMTQEQLETSSGVSRSMIAAIETHKKTGSIATLKKLATALTVDLDNIV